MGPLAQGKKRVKLSLDTLIYQAFRLLCKSRGYGHPSQVLEAYMRACLKNPALPLIVQKLVGGGLVNEIQNVKEARQWRIAQA
ncbi:MAG: hypothetical protein NZ932_05270 [Candidatus Bathyarchaeota archaeon]|nr:hypothetical protein [Candidatus Bathyarchaeota archaeon]